MTLGTDDVELRVVGEGTMTGFDVEVRVGIDTELFLVLDTWVADVATVVGVEAGPAGAAVFSKQAQALERREAGHVPS